MRCGLEVQIDHFDRGPVGEGAAFEMGMTIPRSSPSGSAPALNQFKESPDYLAPTTRCIRQTPSVSFPARRSPFTRSRKSPR